MGQEERQEKMEYRGYKYKPRGCTGGWEVIGDRPVLGPGLGTVNDPFVIREEGRYKMWFSWRKGRVIAYTESRDGLVWDNVQVVLTAVTGSDWEGHEVCRPTVLKTDGMYYMWYTGMMFPTEINTARSCIGFATSTDGIVWERRKDPVLVPEAGWEQIAVCQPHVLREEDGLFRMWYAAGRQHEPDAVGTAVSRDGIRWEKCPENPVFGPDPEHYWEMGKVSSPFIMKADGWYYLFYQGMDGDLIAGEGLARSRDGIHNWQRHPSNPISAGKDGNWDWLGTRKVSLVREQDGYRMWYTGGMREGQAIGVAVHPGFDLGFPGEGETGEDERGFGKGLGSVNYYYRDNIARY